MNKILELFIKENFNDIKKLKNLIDIFDEMNKNNISNININQESDKINNNLKYILHYIKLNNKNILYDDSSILKKEESPLENKNNFITSKITNLKIISTENKKYENIVFTPVFNEMVDLLHFGICTGTPIILEGFPGQGKQKAINYISDLLNYDVENIVITSGFSLDDLFKKTVLESKGNGEFSIEVVDTKLNKMLTKSRTLFVEKKNENKLPDKEDNKNDINENKKPVLFVFHNIQKARADVLSKISDIFNKKSIDCNYFFIGIINIKESFIERK